MTYAQFHLIFTIPLLAIVVWLNWKNEQLRHKKTWFGTGLLLFLAITYTTPWDSYLISQKIWTYENHRVLGTFLLIPFEEYFFFCIQTVIGCLFTLFLLNFFSSPTKPKRLFKAEQAYFFLSAALVWFLCVWFAPTSSQWNYLWLIVVWALPVMVLQWSLGLQVLLSYWKVWLASTVLLTGYFWIADSVAITQGIWSFPPNTISGIEVATLLPLEEALFFLFTNLMVVQGFILFTQVNFSQLKWTRAFEVDLGK